MSWPVPERRPSFRETPFQKEKLLFSWTPFCFSNESWFLFFFLNGGGGAVSFLSGSPCWTLSHTHAHTQTHTRSHTYTYTLTQTNINTHARGWRYPVSVVKSDQTYRTSHQQGTVKLYLAQTGLLVFGKRGMKEKGRKEEKGIISASQIHSTTSLELIFTFPLLSALLFSSSPPSPSPVCFDPAGISWVDPSLPLHFSDPIGLLSFLLFQGKLLPLLLSLSYYSLIFSLMEYECLQSCVYANPCACVSHGFMMTVD